MSTAKNKKNPGFEVSVTEVDASPTVIDLLTAGDEQLTAKLQAYGYTSARVSGDSVWLSRPGRDNVGLRDCSKARDLETLLRLHDRDHWRRMQPTSDWQPCDGPVTIQLPFGSLTFDSGLPHEIERDSIGAAWREVTEPLKVYSDDEAVQLPQEAYQRYSLQKRWLEGKRERGERVILWPDGSWALLPAVSTSADWSLAFNQYEEARRNLVATFNSVLNHYRVESQAEVVEAVGVQ